MINGYINIFILILGGVIGFVVAAITVLYIFKFDAILKERHNVSAIKKKERREKVKKEKPSKKQSHVDEIKSKLCNRGESWVQMNQELDDVDEEQAREYAAKKRKDLDQSYKYAKRR